MILIGQLHPEGVAFVCTDKGTARAFTTLADAEKYLNIFFKDNPEWRIHNLLEIIR
jgi:hypothetical protein